MKYITDKLYDIRYINASLNAASDLAKEQKLNFGDDIACQLRLAKKKRFAIQEERRIAQEIELLSHLNKLLRDDREVQMAKAANEANDDNRDEQIREVEVQYVSAYFSSNKFMQFEYFYNNYIYICLGQLHN